MSTISINDEMSTMSITDEIKNVPTEPGFYWAKSKKDYKWFNLIVHVHGTAPFFTCDVWDRGIHEALHLRWEPWKIVEWGPRIYTPDEIEEKSKDCKRIGLDSDPIGYLNEMRDKFGAVFTKNEDDKQTDPEKLLESFKNAKGPVILRNEVNKQIESQLYNGIAAILMDWKVSFEDCNLAQLVHRIVQFIQQAPDSMISQGDGTLLGTLKQWCDLLKNDEDFRFTWVKAIGGTLRDYYKDYVPKVCTNASIDPESFRDKVAEAILELITRNAE